jgi:hypothetical protein
MSLNIIFTYDVLNDERNDIDDDKLLKNTKGVNSKTELRKRFASMSYVIMNEKDMKKEQKLELIKKLNEALEEKIKQIDEGQDKDEEQETGEDLHGKLEHFITIVLDDVPNQKGFYIKNMYTDNKSLNYPITFIDEVNGFLADIEKKNEIYFTDDIEEKYNLIKNIAENTIRHQISKIVPNKQPVGGRKNKKTKRRKNKKSRKNKKNKSKKLRK